VAAGSGLLLIVFAAVVRWHYQQIEWHLTTPVPMASWYLGAAAGLLGGPLFFAAVGLGQRSDVLPVRPVRNLIWYALSTMAVLAILWRYGSAYGLAPVRDLPELLRFVLLPPAGLSVIYGLAVFPLIARVVRGLPTWLVLSAGVTVAVLAAVGADRVPVLGTTAELTRYLLFFLIGSRLGRAAEARLAREAPALTRPLAALGHAAAPIAAALLPIIALSGAVAVKRLSVLEGTAQMGVAVVEPVLFTLAIVTVGVVAHRILGAVR
jgi:hypothetical protein